MIKKISSEKGASSIMVILLLVVLVVFGIAALTTALSNMRLGQKVSDWNDKYYTAEGVASERFAMIDNAVEDAFAQGGNINEAVSGNIAKLGFEAKVESGGSVINISYETWNEDIGIRAVLALDENDMHSLRAVQWVEIQ